MKLLTIILILIIGCQEPEIKGCMSQESCNYNPNSGGVLTVVPCNDGAGEVDWGNNISWGQMLQDPTLIWATFWVDDLGHPYSALCDYGPGSSFPIGVTTVTCNSGDAAYPNVPTASFTVTVNYISPPFTTVSSIDSQGNTCLGFENPPTGMQSVWLIGPEGNMSGTHNITNPTVLSDGMSCQSGMSSVLAGEYKFAALSSPTATPSSFNIIEYSTLYAIQYLNSKN